MRGSKLFILWFRSTVPHAEAPSAFVPSSPRTRSAVRVIPCWFAKGRRSIRSARLPNFNLTDEEYRELADFLLWTNTINTQGWPPNDAG